MVNTSDNNWKFLPSNLTEGYVILIAVDSSVARSFILWHFNSFFLLADARILECANPIKADRTEKALWIAMFEMVQIIWLKPNVPMNDVYSTIEFSTAFKSTLWID